MRTQSESGNEWVQSFHAGSIDESTGNPIHGTEIVHLAGHKGRLYSGNGYWMDSRGYDNISWSKLLVQESPEAAWKVDLALGARHLRVTALQSLTFTTDGNGNSLASPVNLLLAASDHNQESNIWTRDDGNDTWVKTTLQVGGKYKRSTRAFIIHRDQETGIDRVFVAAGEMGIYSGVYDADQSGKIRWDEKPELGPVVIRPMSFTEANDAVYASVGTSVYRRVDGLNPGWEEAYSDDTRENWGLGGIRGLTAVASDDETGESILFSHTDRIIRVDPLEDYRSTVELSIRPMMHEYLGRAVNGNIILAFSAMLPVTDPGTGHTVHLMGAQAQYERDPDQGNHGKGKVYEPNTSFGFYPGGLYLIRKSAERYRMQDINGRWEHGKPILKGPRVFAFSPFDEDAGEAIYCGGYDASNYPARDTAWIFCASVESVLSSS